MTTLRKAFASVAVLGAVTAAGVLGVGAPAEADPVTPYLDCTTGTGGSFGNFHGWADCTGSGKWKLRVDCSFGFTTDSNIVLSFQSTDYKEWGNCYWGVNSVTVVPVADM